LVYLNLKILKTDCFFSLLVGMMVLNKRQKESCRMTPDFKRLNHQDIIFLIPHRYPFLLVDQIEDIFLGKSAVGIKNVSINEWYFQGHFPHYPIMPGVLIVEAMAQTAGALVVKTLQEQGEASDSSTVYFMSIEEAKFRKPVHPGDTLRMKVEKERSRGNIWKFKGEAWIEDGLASEAIFTAMIAKS
jgi:3-hydroxyacyl-[acyl-carrier-protein] dehydratase